MILKDLIISHINAQLQEKWFTPSPLPKNKSKQKENKQTAGIRLKSNGNNQCFLKATLLRSRQIERTIFTPSIQTQPVKVKRVVLVVL